MRDDNPAQARYWMTGLWAAGVLMYAAILAYAWYTEASTAISKDLWRYIPILEKYYESGFSFSILLLKHAEHLQLAYNGWFLLNAVAFGLNTRLELLLGFGFLGVGAIFFYKGFSRSLGPDVPQSRRSLLFLPLLGIYFSFNQETSFTYGLLAFDVFGEYLLMMGFILAFDCLLVEQKPGWSAWVGGAVSFLLLGGGFAGGGWLVYFLAATAVQAVWWLTRRPALHQRIWLVIWQIAVTVPVYWVNTLVADKGRPGTGGAAVEYLVQHLGEVVQYVLILLSTSVIDVNALEARGLGSLAYGVGGGLLLAHLLAGYLFFSRRMWEKTYMPLYLMAVFWLVALALLFYRFPTHGVANAASPRYASTLQIGLLGVVWVFLWLMRDGAGQAWRWGRIMVAGILLLYIFQLNAAFHRAPFMRDFARKGVAIVENEQFEKPTIICPHESLCRQGVLVLKEHHLNVFREKDADSP